METKSFEAEVTLKAGAEGDSGVIKGYASTYDVDRSEDQFVSGAWGRIDNPVKTIKMLYQHQRNKPAGVWDIVREEAKGLYVEGRLAMKTTTGQEAYELIKMGAVSDLSVGFRTLKSKDVKATVEGRQTYVRQILSAKLFEISPVSIPDNPYANITAVKQADDELLSERELERRLRDAGVSRKHSVTLVAEGFSRLEQVFLDTLMSNIGLSEKQAKAFLTGGYEDYCKSVRQRDAGGGATPLVTPEMTDWLKSFSSDLK
jgi:HK97 family phage prohead protease